MNKTSRNEKRKLRQKRVRARVFGTAERPRLSVFRSNSHISAQLIDDEKGETLVFAGDTEIETKGKKTESVANLVGLEIAKKAKTKKISKVVFDRSGYIFTGKVKALAEGARSGGLEF